MTDMTIRTDVHGARTLRQMIEGAGAQEATGPTTEPIAGNQKSVAVEIITTIAGDDASQHNAVLLKLSGNNLIDSGHRVKIRNISRTGLTAGDRYVAKPVSNLGLCVEASAEGDGFIGYFPNPQAFCCGACLPEHTYMAQGKPGAASYQFFAPAIKCCPSCNPELQGDTAYPALSGQVIDLTFESSSGLYVSTAADCGDTETVRWELALGSETLIYRESTGTALVTYVARRPPLRTLCPMRFELDTYNTELCYVCGDEICVKPSQYEPTTGCMGCSESKQFPAFYQITTGNIELDGGTEQIAEATTSWTSGTEYRYWHIRRPDLSEARDPIVTRAPLLVDGSPICAWWRTRYQIWYLDGHRSTFKQGSIGCCNDANYDGRDATLVDRGLIDIVPRLPFQGAKPVVDTAVMVALRPSSLLGCQADGEANPDRIIAQPAGGTNCQNAFPTSEAGVGNVFRWFCFWDTLGWGWRVSGSGGNMTVSLIGFSPHFYRYQRVRDTADSCSETRALGEVMAPAGAPSVPGGNGQVGGFEANWTATDICPNTGAITCTLVGSPGGFLTLPTTITVIPSNAEEPPQQQIRRNCEEPE